MQHVDHVLRLMLLQLFEMLVMVAVTYSQQSFDNVVAT